MMTDYFECGRSELNVATTLKKMGNGISGSVKKVSLIEIEKFINTYTFFHLHKNKYFIVIW